MEKINQFLNIRIILDKNADLRVRKEVNIFLLSFVMKKCVVEIYELKKGV